MSGELLPAGAPRASGLLSFISDPPRTRTWNLRLRRPTPCPLGQRATGHRAFHTGADVGGWVWRRKQFPKMATGTCQSMVAPVQEVACAILTTRVWSARGRCRLHKAPLRAFVCAQVRPHAFVHLFCVVSGLRTSG